MSRQILVLGIGNRLMSDDAAGIIVVEQLSQEDIHGVRVIDGGTIGMALLPEIEDAAGLIAVDAATFDAPPGTMQVFAGEEMDRMLAGRKKTAHEVALSDLIGAAAFSGSCPKQRALVAVVPEKISLGMEPTQKVAAALPQMVEAVRALISQWQTEAVAA